MQDFKHEEGAELILRRKGMPTKKEKERNVKPEKATDKQSYKQNTRAGEGAGSLGLVITLVLLLIYRWEGT